MPKGGANTPNRPFAYQNLLYGEQANRSFVLTAFQLKAWIPLDAQAPGDAIAGLPGMVKFWLEEQHPGGRFPIEAIRGEIPFPDAAPGLVCDALSLLEKGSWSFRLIHPDAGVGGRTLDYGAGLQDKARPDTVRRQSVLTDPD